MIELIATIILLFGLTGMTIIGFRKTPVLIELPETLPMHHFKDISLRLKENIVNLNPLKRFSTEIFLQKILSKVRILSLKTENKMANWLKTLREKSKKKKNDKNDNYWQELQKTTKKKDK